MTIGAEKCIGVPGIPEGGIIPTEKGDRRFPTANNAIPNVTVGLDGKNLEKGGWGHIWINGTPVVSKEVKAGQSQELKYQSGGVKISATLIGG